MPDMTLADFAKMPGFQAATWPCCGREVVLGPASTSMLDGEAHPIKCHSCGAPCVIVRVGGEVSVRKVGGEA